MPSSRFIPLFAPRNLKQLPSRPPDTGIEGGGVAGGGAKGAAAAAAAAAASTKVVGVEVDTPSAEQLERIRKYQVSPFPFHFAAVGCW